MQISFLDNEYWYGGCVKYGIQMPLHAGCDVTLDFTINRTPNQAAPLLLSTKGRVLHDSHGFQITVSGGTMTVPDTCILETPGSTLRDAYLYAAGRYFPFSPHTPDAALFGSPIYNTWIELTFDQNEADILRYAQNILSAGMPPGVLMIDDGWSEYYGEWSFHAGAFPDPKEMIRKLHHMGFHVMLWICPFITADTVRFREAHKKGILVRRPDGSPYIVNWWNGYSALLDITSPSARSWLTRQLDHLTELGVDGFKFDAGDSLFYDDDIRTYRLISPDEHSLEWNRFGESYPFNEYRTAWNAGGKALLQRLCDKPHTWADDGISSLIPDTLLQGLLGYPYSCPDMVGGGEYTSFLNTSPDMLDEELFIRHSEIACLMPAIQFSAAPFRVLGKNAFSAIMSSLRTRALYQSYISDELRKIPASGEPLVRYMSYEFAHEPVEMLTDQFMIGSSYLVAPVCKKSMNGRSVYLPKGTWLFKGAPDETQIAPPVESPGRFYTYSSRPGVPLIFERLT